ncbi:MAG: Fic family protein [Syntrophaceae bacterium]
MSQIRIFISSVQKEFARERKALRDFLRGDPLLRRFFDVFLFEDVPAIDRRADEVYLHEVKRCDIYVGLFGKEYGQEDEKGYSPTHREFDLATRLGKHRLIFVKGADDDGKVLKMRALIKEAGDQVVRRRFISAAELVAAIYGSLVQYLDEHELIRSAPFDASFCRNATMGDLDEEKIHTFVSLARRARGFPLPEESTSMEVLTHLNLLDKERPSHAAVLLFGKQPQRFLISSEIKCAHFHGVEVTKPIPFYRVYKGTVFDLVDQAVDFVLSKIDLAVGTRAHSIQAPVAYEIPPEVISEAIVNAVAHRDYTSNGSVQVMLFADRLEVWNPGTLPPPLTLAKLRKPHGSVPCNPLLAEPLYLTKYIERMGTGTGDMIRRCRNFGLDEPEFALTDGFVVTIRRKPDLAFKTVGGITGEVAGVVTGEVTGEVRRLLTVLVGEMKRTDIQEALALRHEDYFREAYLVPALVAGMIEMTIPGKPTSSKQKYRLTQQGRDLVAKLAKGVK